MVLNDVNYDAIQGDSFQLDFTYTDSLGAAINLTGYTILVEVRDKPGGKVLCATCSIGDGVTVTSAASGLFSLVITPTKTKNFVYPKSAYQVQAMSSSGIVTTLLKGWINVDAGVIP